MTTVRSVICSTKSIATELISGWKFQMRKHYKIFSNIMVKMAVYALCGQVCLISCRQSGQHRSISWLRKDCCTKQNLKTWENGRSSLCCSIFKMILISTKIIYIDSFFDFLCKQSISSTSDNFRKVCFHRWVKSLSCIHSLVTKCTWTSSEKRLNYCLSLMMTVLLHGASEPSKSWSLLVTV